MQKNDGTALRVESFGLRTGDYYAFAFDCIEKGLLEDVEFVRRLAPRAARIEVRNRETATVDFGALPWADYQLAYELTFDLHVRSVSGVTHGDK